MIRMTISYDELQSDKIEKKLFAGKGWYGSGINTETRRRDHSYDVETPEDISDIIMLCTELEESINPDYEYFP